MQYDTDYRLGYFDGIMGKPRAIGLSGHSGYRAGYDRGLSDLIRRENGAE